MLRHLVHRNLRTQKLSRGIEAGIRASRAAVRQPVEALETRRHFAVTASFTPALGLLQVNGDALANSITVGRNAAGTILVNGGAVAIAGGPSTIANTSKMIVFGNDQDDTITFDETLGAIPSGELYGGNGNDSITAGSSADTIFGQAGNDTLLSRGGLDLISGGGDNDTITGGDADDQVFGDDGNDRMIWNPGDDTDLNEGGAGTDTVEVNGGGAAEVFTTTANGTRVRFDRLDPAPFSLDINLVENLVLNANGGNDQFSNTGNLASLISITADGGTGNDTLLGSNGIDLLLGGDNDDFIDGQQGNDTAFLGAGNDVFQWDPGDGSDVVEGQDGDDTLLFNGSAGAEIFAASSNGGRVTFTRNLGTITMDLNDVESLDLRTLGGADTLTANNLAGTDLTEMNIDHAGTIGGSIGDAAADVVIVNGTNNADVIDVFGSGTAFSVLGLHARVNVTNSEGANDALVVNGLGGADGITSTTVPAGVVKLTLDGGADNDSLLGSQGADVFLGGAGDDFVFGDNGNDTAFLGANNDVFQWDPGDGNDVIEGQDGTDELLFFGANIAEVINITPNGGRVLFLRDVANVTMDMDDVESFDFRALGGADNIVVGDLTGTDATTIDLNLTGPNGGGDAAADSVTVNATNLADVFGAFTNGTGARVFGLQTQVNILSPEVASDRLTLNGQGEADVIDASSLTAGIIATTFNGGLGNDVILGSAGDDLINGGDGNDNAFMGNGNDTFTWNPGDDNDVLEGQLGTDTMQFNGANIAENISISPNGGRVTFTRDIATVVMDLNDTEVINFAAVGGADTINVNHLSATDVTNVNLALGVGGAGDAAIDTVNIFGSAGVDAMNISADAVNGLTVSGTGATVNATGIEPANDRFNFRPLGGADVVSFNSIAGINGTAMFVALESTNGGGTADGLGDSVTVNFDGAANSPLISDVGATTGIGGATTAITIAHADNNDSLRINALGGADTITVNQNGIAGAVKRVIVDAGSETDSIVVVNTQADGSATILPSAGNDVVSVNLDGLFGANAIFSGTQTIGSLSIGTGGRATVAANGNTVLTTTGLGISGSSRLDLTDNTLIVDYATISPINTIQSLLTSGYNGGAWTGVGINSSSAATTANRALGYAQSNEIFTSFPANIGGQPVDATMVIVRFTLPGDTNLDRTVNIGDFSALASNFNATGTRWVRGNFNYDSATNVSDFSALASNFNATLPATFGRVRIGEEILSA